MQKRKVHEIAKEYHVTNREILEFLKSRDVDVKSHMSSIDTPQEKLIREEFSQRSGKQIENTEAKSQLQRETNHKEKTENKENKEVKGQDRTTVRPKKKNLIQVFRPQNAKTPEGKNFHKNAVKPSTKQGTKAAKPEPARKKAAPKAETAPKAEAAPKTETVVPKAEPISREETAAKVASRMASAAKAIARPEKTEAAPSVREETVAKTVEPAAPKAEKPADGQVNAPKGKALEAVRTTEAAKTSAPKEERPKTETARSEGEEGTRNQRRVQRGVSQTVTGSNAERRSPVAGQRRNGSGSPERRGPAASQAQGQRRQDGDRRSTGTRSGLFGQRRDGQGQRGFGGGLRSGDGARGPRNGQDGQRTGGVFGQRRQDGDRRGPGTGRGFAQGGEGRRQAPFDNKRGDSRKPAVSEDLGLAKKPSRDGKKEKSKEREKVSQRENKMTNDRKTGGNRPNQGFRQNSRLPKALQKPARPQPKREEPKEVIKEIKIPEKLTIRELAEAMKKNRWL